MRNTVILNRLRVEFWFWEQLFKIVYNTALRQFKKAAPVLRSSDIIQPTPGASVDFMKLGRRNVSRIWRSWHTASNPSSWRKKWAKWRRLTWQRSCVTGQRSCDWCDSGHVTSGTEKAFLVQWRRSRELGSLCFPSRKSLKPVGFREQVQTVF